MDRCLSSQPASLICTIVDQSPATTTATHAASPKNGNCLKSTGITDTASFDRCGVLHLDDVRYNYTGNASFHIVDSVGAHWNTGREEIRTRLQNLS